MKEAGKEKLPNKVVKWLDSPDSSTNHETARKKYTEKTGKWFIDSNYFNRWKSGAIHSIWIKGIPGAGKTILFSSAVETLKTTFAANKRKPFAYFYFDFNDPNKRTVVQMLRSILQQFCLCLGDIPKANLDLYKQCHSGNERPMEGSILKALQSLTSRPEQYFILLDALDECIERENLSEVISEILQHNSINLLITSREENVFVDTFQDNIDMIPDLKG